MYITVCTGSTYAHGTPTCTRTRTLGGHLAAARPERGAGLLEAAVVVVLILGVVAALGGAVLEGALAGDGAAGSVAAIGAGAHLRLLGGGLLASKLLLVVWFGSGYVRLG